MKVVIIDYGAGNVFSVQQAFNRIGVETHLTNDPTVIQSADRIIFPGVGHAKPAMEELKKNGLDQLIPTLNQPVLGICLGMQLMCNETDEGTTKGLGIFDTTVDLFSEQVVVPHIGWNDVRFAEDVIEPYYFVHSFKAPICADTWGICDYEQPFSAALRKNQFWGVQFHPEKSGTAGEQFLLQFINQ